MAVRRYGGDSWGGEYPDRYSVYNDEAENKHIINKNENVLAGEIRHPDGSLTVEDARLGTTEFTDPYGTRIWIDRKNQEAIIIFGGCKFTISQGTFKIDSGTVEVVAKQHVNFIGRLSASIKSPVLNLLGKAVNLISKNNQEPY